MTTKQSKFRIKRLSIKTIPPNFQRLFLVVNIAGVNIFEDAYVNSNHADFRIYKKIPGLCKIQELIECYF
jgi:hypothetical protein